MLIWFVSLMVVYVLFGLQLLTVLLFAFLLVASLQFRWVVLFNGVAWFWLVDLPRLFSGMGFCWVGLAAGGCCLMAIGFIVLGFGIWFGVLLTLIVCALLCSCVVVACLACSLVACLGFDDCYLVWLIVSCCWVGCSVLWVVRLVVGFRCFWCFG